MLFLQFVDEGLGCGSYLVGDEETGEALVVDPAYAVEQYLAAAEHHGVRLTRVVETHNHADHVSGHGRLALEQGASVAVHALAEPAYPANLLSDGDAIDVGSVRLRTVHTPGHRPEHCCFTVADRTRAEEPWLVLTGDSLFIGDAARPDLAVAAREGAEGLFGSLHRLLELDDGVEVYPGHVAGSLCGAGMSSKASSTIGFERRFNHALRNSDLADFVNERMRVTAPRPPNMDRIVALNRGPFLGAPPPVPPVGSTDGATVLDVRDVREHAAGHVPGAINVPVDGSSFATKSGFVLAPDDRIVVHAASPDQAERALRGLRSIGLLDVAGVLEHAAATEMFDPLDFRDLEQALADGATVLDVREKDERDGGYIPGSRNIPYRQVAEYAHELGDGPVVTVCETGPRAAIAASVLRHEGVDARPVLDSGVTEWSARGKPLVSFRRCGR